MFKVIQWNVLWILRLGDTLWMDKVEGVTSLYQK